MMFKAVTIAALVAVASATAEADDCYTWRRGRTMGRRIGRAFCRLSADQVENGLPDAPRIRDYCVDAALTRCERSFAKFVNDRCPENKAWEDTYEQYKEYCEGTMDDDEEVAPAPLPEPVPAPVPQQPTLVVCTWGVDCPGSVNACPPGDYSCSCPNGYDCSYPNGWNNYPNPDYVPCRGYGCPKPDPQPCTGYGCPPKPCKGRYCPDDEPEPIETSTTEAPVETITEEPAPTTAAESSIESAPEPEPEPVSE